jgi:hypothetical protein
MRKTSITSSIVIIALVAVCMQGCIVVSIHPFYKESDVTYNKAFEGEWTDQDNNRWQIHQNPFKQNSYELHTSKNGRNAQLIGHLFNLGEDLYLDLVPTGDNTEEVLIYDLHLIPTHSIAKIDKLTNSEVVIKWFNEEWLRKMFTQNKIRIDHEMIMDENPKSKDDGMYLLTASTEDLQKFVEKYGDDENAYDSDLKLQLTK